MIKLGLLVRLNQFLPKLMIKRIFDIISSLMGLLILFPLLILIAFWVKVDSDGPIFFRQIRVGQHGREFRIHKFRTMVDRASNQGLSITVGEDNRITKSGKFLRKYKLDELPQLFDVLRGKMSMVGPRPEVPLYVNYYPEGIKEKVLSIKPGITDLASIQMINESQILASFNDPHKAYIEVIIPLKLKFNLEYLKERNFLFDIKIILLTLKRIVTR